MIKPATPLPWSQNGTMIEAECVIVGDLYSWGVSHPDTNEADTAYIVQCANAYPKLVERVAELEAREKALADLLAASLSMAVGPQKAESEFVVRVYFDDPNVAGKFFSAISALAEPGE